MRQRADAVISALRQVGFTVTSVTTEGRGETQLRITEADCKAKGHAKTQQALIACLAPDRRVDVEVTGVQKQPGT